MYQREVSHLSAAWRPAHPFITLLVALMMGQGASAQTAPPLPVLSAAPAAGSTSQMPANPANKKVQSKSVKANPSSPAPVLSQNQPNPSPPTLPPPSKVTQDFYNSYLSGNMDLAVLLLQQGADINCGNCGEAPLLSNALARSFIGYGGIADHITWLLSRGADPNAQDKEGRTAVYDYIATVSQWGGGLYQVGQVSDQQLLAWLRAYLKAGGNPQLAAPNGTTPLHVIARMIQVIDAGNSKMQQRYQALIDEMLVHGADINAKTLDQGYTPLMVGLGWGGFGMGSSECNHEMVSYFLSRGADLNVVGKDGKTAYDIALNRAIGGNKACNLTLAVLKGPAPKAYVISARMSQAADRSTLLAASTPAVAVGNLAGQWQGVLRVKSPSIMVVPVTGSIDAGGTVQLKAPGGVTTGGTVKSREGDNIVLRLKTRAPEGARFSDGSRETAEFLVTGQLSAGVFRGDYIAPTDSGEFVLCDGSASANRDECRPTALESLGGALGALLGAARAVSGN
jgi:hypothetical protein